ncbi:PHP domain-containing protein [Candidatus Parcubacteria bacterium]|nr:MAG: PHP domain-containing protein [Candidatus Parcubacteria bacterium]
MTHPFDFQIQTTASDGKHTPAECVRMAHENGVGVIAITDHDTVAGVREAQAEGMRLGVRVISGVELSIQEHGMHLLGLGIDIDHAPLVAALARAAQNRLAAAQEMVKKFQAGGFAVTWEEVLREAGDAIVTRPHIVAAIMKRPENADKLSGITTKHEFFEKYFSDKGPYYVRASTLTPREAIALVHAAGGLAVWSHPPVPDFVGKCAELGSFLNDLMGYGLDGVEQFGSALTDADCACLEMLSRQYSLIRTAGSDFHEANPAAPDSPWPRSARTIGEFPTFGRSLGGIVEAFDDALARKRSVADPA